MFTNLKNILINSLKNKALPLGCLGLVGLGAYACTDNIPSSHIGYANLYGKINEKKIYPGIHLKNPFVQFIKIPLLTDNLALDINIATKEGLSLSVQTNTIYKLDEDKTLSIYLKYKKNYGDIFIKPLIESSLRNLMSSYEAKDLYSESTRMEIKNRMEDEIKKEVWVREGFMVENFLINKINLPTQLQQSIENKLKAEQENEQMAFIIEKEKKQITFGIEKEKMEAERKKIEADG